MTIGGWIHSASGRILPHLWTAGWGRSRECCWFRSLIDSLQQIQVRELDKWLGLSWRPTSPISTGHVDEIARHITLLVDSSLITALLSISNYIGCLAECEGRWTLYWKSLYWQYNHQAVMLCLLKQPFSSQVIAARSSAGFHLAFI